MTGFRIRAAVGALAALLGAAGCEEAPADTVPVGLLLSYTGELSANSTNSERAVLMAIQAANAAGGVGDKAIRLMARDIRSDPTKATRSARELVDAGVPVFLGLDNRDLATELKSVLADRTTILPSFTTASNFSKPHSWFVMGAAAPRVACELVAQLRADGRQRPLLIASSAGYNSLLAWELARTYGMPTVVLPTDQAATTSTVKPIVNMGADAYVLAALPPSAATLIYAMAAAGELRDPRQWYLSPTLHTPAFLETIPKGILTGAHGVAAGTVAGAADFRAAFSARWGDQPLDDAYPFYDAAAVAVLALERAQRREGALPAGNRLAKHIVAVTNPGGTPVNWDELGRGLGLLRAGQEVAYVGLSGPLKFDLSGQTPAAATKWWTISERGFDDVPHTDQCAARP